LCRAVEPTQGNRTIKSYEAELARVYNVPARTLAPPAPPAPPTAFPMIRLDGDTVHIYLQHRTISVVMPPQHRIQFMTPHQLHLIALQFAQLYPPPVAPVIPRIWCQSGRRTLGLCPTKSKTRRRCSFDNCSLRVCIACKRCTTH
jgi:hypothetical protein